MPASDRTLRELLTLSRATQLRGFILINWLRAQARLPAVITEGRRSQARQRQLYEQGRTRPGPIVTNTLTSRHRGGKAFDIAFLGVSPNQAVNAGWFDLAGRAGESLGLRWGGRFRKLKDFGHFER